MTDHSVFSSLTISELVPHQAPMILVDKLIHVDETSIHTQVTIQADGLFFDKHTQSVPGYVGIEYMAQSIAAWSGYQAKQKGQSPAIGFLLGSRRYHSECPHFHLGETLDIHAQHLMDSNGMAAFQCQILLQEQEIASAQLNAFVPSEQQLTEMLSE